MTDEERDDLLERIETGQAELRAAVQRVEKGQAELRAGQDELSDQIQEVARAVRELGGYVTDEPPEEATG